MPRSSPCERERSRPSGSRDEALLAGRCDRAGRRDPLARVAVADRWRARSITFLTGRRARDLIAPVALVALLLGAWECYVDLGGADPLILPAPHAIASSLYVDRALLWRNFLVTAEEVLLGMAVAIAAGLALAILIHFSAILRRALYPLLVASQTLPIPVVAPVLVLWLGFGLLPKLSMVALVAFFPIVITTLAGLESVDPDLIKLMRTFDASPLRIFREVELPAALPGLFTGAKLAAVFAVLGAVFAEWAGASSGLGYLFNVSLPQLLMARSVRVRRRALGVCDRAVRAVERRAAADASLDPPIEWRDETMRSTGRRSVRRGAVLLAGIVLASAALAGCGETTNVLTPSESAFQPLTVMLDWSPDADHAGIYQAQAEGDFKRAALNVNIEYNTSDPSAPLRLLEAGKVQVAIAYEPEVLLARNENLPLVSIAALVQRPLTSIISLGNQHIKTPADLRGKTVGVAGIPYQTAFLQTILQHAAVPQDSVKVVNVGENLVPAMLSGRVNATLGAYWNYEAIQLMQLGKHPNVIHTEQAGVPDYNELVFVVKSSEIYNHPYLLRAFVQAVARGYQSARAHPAQAVANLIAANPNAGLDAKLQLASVKATMRYWFPAAGKPWGWQSPSQWSTFGKWMTGEGLISNPNATTDASTNELLAGQGV